MKGISTCKRNREQREGNERKRQSSVFLCAPVGRGESIHSCIQLSSTAASAKIAILIFSCFDDSEMDVHSLVLQALALLLSFVSALSQPAPSSKKKESRPDSSYDDYQAFMCARILTRLLLRHVNAEQLCMHVCLYVNYPKDVL